MNPPTTVLAPENLSMISLPATMHRFRNSSLSVRIGEKVWVSCDMPQMANFMAILPA